MINKKELICASVTIYDEANHISDSEMLNLWNKNLSEGIDGFFLGGSVAECFMLTNKERIHLFELAASNIGKKANLYAHVGSISTDEAIDFGHAAHACGITNIASTPPFYFAFTPKEIAHYYYDLAEALDTPILYYDIPSSTNVELNTDNPEIQALLKSGAINAIKHTNLQSYRMKKIRTLNPNIKIMGGFESKVIPMLNYECDGFIGSTFNVMFPQYKKIIQTYNSSSKTNLYNSVKTATDILTTLLECGLPASIKYLLKKQGIEAGTVRKPLLSLTESSKNKLDQVYQTLQKMDH